MTSTLIRIVLLPAFILTMLLFGLLICVALTIDFLRGGVILEKVLKDRLNKYNNEKNTSRTTD